MDFQMHTREQVYELVEKAFQLGIKPDELHIAISRLTNVREREPIRNKMLDAEHDKFVSENEDDSRLDRPPYGVDE